SGNETGPRHGVVLGQVHDGWCRPKLSRAFPGQQSFAGTSSQKGSGKEPAGVEPVIAWRRALGQEARGDSPFVPARTTATRGDSVAADAPPPSTDQSAPGPEAYTEVQECAEFGELRRSHRSFAFPRTVAFIVWYLLYVLCSNCAG